MKYGICQLSIVPVREDKSDRSEMVTQLLYGELFKILETRKKWWKVRSQIDNYEGWIDPKQGLEISEQDYLRLAEQEAAYSLDLVDFIQKADGQLLTIPLGSQVDKAEYLGHQFEGRSLSGSQPKERLVQTALLYMHAPYLWGGKTPFGIDCSGFTQLVYRLNGISILRDASQQATLGEALSFIEESEPGDLVFFDNEEGLITHVGIMLPDNHIIHAHGEVRIDRIDHSGIFNTDIRQHTHKLRVIKRIV
ncbi:C40 family peptidase [Aureitalea marina]|uniref:Hydrolase Nlp/P60 n=1 Tax=Aureitalea marina TaxID=930804 RepID=A0A2S7KP27_9FLAO|nr:C40 family peptidase [Aureitalea marina]PQB04323.1 hydrolase Nlp/P60 [Aureitalea marina]